MSFSGVVRNQVISVADAKITGAKGRFKASSFGLGDLSILPALQRPIRANEPLLLSADQIRKLSVSEFGPWIEHVFENPSLYSKSALNRGWLSECSCPLSKGHHDRELKGNTRTRAEEAILKHTQTMGCEKISLLSMGSGRLLQDLIIVASLLKQGFGHVSLCLVEKSWRSRLRSAQTKGVFKAIVSQLKKRYPDVRIKIAYSSSSGIIPADKTYDVVYAIDFNEFQVSTAGSSDQRRTYRAQIDLAKAVMRLSDSQNAAFFISQGFTLHAVVDVNASSRIRRHNLSQAAPYYKYGVGQVLLDTISGALDGRSVYIDRLSLNKNDEHDFRRFAQRFNLKYKVVNGAPSEPYVTAGNLKGTFCTQLQIVDYLVKYRSLTSTYNMTVMMLKEYVGSKLGAPLAVENDAALKSVLWSIQCVTGESNTQKAKSVLTPAISLLYKKLRKKARLLKEI